MNVPQMAGVIGLGLGLFLAAGLGKSLGCGLPAMIVGFNGRRAARIVVGMLPRGEVALIVASVGLTSGVIGAEIYGVAILLVVLTTILASALLPITFAPRAAT